MPNITEETRRLPKTPEDRPIGSTSCCGRCAYNIPQGSLMVLLPGFTLFLCGAITFATADDPLDFASYTQTASLAVLVVGAALTLAGGTFCALRWCKHKPRPQRKPDKTSMTSAQKAPVSLVAIHIYQPGDNPGYRSGSKQGLDNPAYGTDDVLY